MILFNNNEPPKKETVEGDTDQSEASSENAPASREAGNFTLGPGRVRRPKFKLWLFNEGKNFVNVYDRPNYLNTNIVELIQ